MGYRHWLPLLVAAGVAPGSCLALQITIAGGPISDGNDGHDQRRSALSYAESPVNFSAGVDRFARNCNGAWNSKNASVMTDLPNATKMMRLLELEASAWIELPPTPYVNRAPKLALMMFTKDIVNNEQAWLNWMDRARRDGLEFSLFIHTQGLPSRIRSRGLLLHVVHTNASVKWCNMWEAQVFLMSQALHDPEVSHFMVLSHNSIPVKPLRIIYQELAADPATRMCADDAWRGIPGDPLGSTPRAETWWLMRREDAELFLYNRDFARLFTFPGCVDEHAWYYPLKMRSLKWGDKVELRNECTMFADWADGPRACKYWRKSVDQCAGCEKLRDSPRLDATALHPATFLHINASALQGLIDSPFWFARKFEDGALDDAAIRWYE